MGRVAVGESCPWEVSACGMVGPISVSVPLSSFGWLWRSIFLLPLMKLFSKLCPYTAKIFRSLVGELWVEIGVAGEGWKVGDRVRGGGGCLAG